MGISKRNGGWGFRLKENLWNSENENLRKILREFENHYDRVCVLRMERGFVDFVKNDSCFNWTQKEASEREKFFLEIAHNLEEINQKQEKIQIISNVLISSKSKEDVIFKIGKVLLESGIISAQDYQKLVA